MRDWTPQQVAAAAGASRDRRRPATDRARAGDDRLARRGPRGSVRRAAWASTTTAASSPRRRSRPAPGERSSRPHTPTRARAGLVLTAPDPLKALQALATAWRRELNAEVIGVTGSTGKTSTKDLLLALLAPHRNTIASRANFNTEIGLPLEILAAPPETEVLVLEMAMRGSGQIAELTAIAEPDVGVIVSIGPVHLELLGTVENDRRREGRADRRADAGVDRRHPRLGAAARTAPARRPADGHVRARGRCELRQRARRAGRDRRHGRRGSSSRCRSARPICGPICWPPSPARGRSG